MVFQRENEGREVVSVEVMSGDKRQRLSVVQREEATLVLSEGGAKLRSWPLQAVKLATDLPGNNISVEAGGETFTWSCVEEASRQELGRSVAAVVLERSEPLADAALAELLQSAVGAGPDGATAEQWGARLAQRLARLDALNVGGMLAAATEGGGAQLSERLEAGVSHGAALSARLARYDVITRAAAGATQARSGAARADANARALLQELTEIYEWLDAPGLGDLDAIPQISLGTAEGRAQALAVSAALRAALRAGGAAPGRRRLGAVRARLARLQRATDQLSAALARHLNNALIHLGNSNSNSNEPEADSQTQSQSHSHIQRHHAALRGYAPFMRCLKLQDDRAYQALQKVYVSTWSRLYEREVRAACDAAKARLAMGHPVDTELDQVLDLVEDLCNREQDFCTHFFQLDLDVKSENSDGERSSGGDSGGARGAAPGGAAAAAARRLVAALVPGAEPELLGLLAHAERADPLGAMRALACVSRRVLGSGEAPSTPTAATAGTPAAGTPAAGTPAAGTPAAGPPEARCSRSLLAAVAVAAKRGADRIVADKIAAYPDHIKQAARRPKCGVLGFIPELESLARQLEATFGGARRADLERWYLALAAAVMASVAGAEHPRTPRALLQTENYHALYSVLSQPGLRAASLESQRRECRARYGDSLRAYVTRQLGRPLEKLTHFFEGVSEAVASGVREEEVCYQAAYSKHELKRLLALYPAREVRKSLHRLYRLVEKQASEEGGLLQVVWRAMQEEFLAQHQALQSRTTSCYAGSGLSLPLTTQDILDAFSDIAREH